MTQGSLKVSIRCKRLLGHGVPLYGPALQTGRMELSVCSQIINLRYYQINQSFFIVTKLVKLQLEMVISLLVLSQLVISLLVLSLLVSLELAVVWIYP